MPPPRMTANPVKPARYRPGKGPDEPSSDSDEEDEELDQEQSTPPQSTTTSRPTQVSTKQATSAVRKVSLEERRARIAASEARLAAEKAAIAAVEDEFETEESGSEKQGTENEGCGSISEKSTEEESSSSEDEAPRKLLRPTFIRKDQRAGTNTADADAERTAELEAEEAARTKEAATALVQDQLEKRAAARAAGKKDWDESDDDINGFEGADDTDGLDPEAEQAAWKLRELKRVQRARAAVEEAEKEREERERRRALSPGARAKEDEAFLAKQKEELESKGKAGFMQRYHHKGAFFQDDLKDKGLDRRDLMGSRYVDDVGGAGASGAGKETLPEYMQIRDMTKLGKKGRTKYRDLKTEDTGRWGDYASRRRDNKGFVGADVDERFQPDRMDGNGRDEPTGANATAVRERPREPQAQPQGSGKEPYRNGKGQEENDIDRNNGDKAERHFDRNDRRGRDHEPSGGGASYRPGRRRDDRDSKDYRRNRRDRSLSRSRSRSPPRRRRRSYSRSPPRRKRSIPPYVEVEKKRRIA